GALYVVGGVSLVGEKAERRYHRDGYRYDAGSGWKRVADLPHHAAAAPSPAPADGAGFTVLGGDDGTQIGVAPTGHRGFNRLMLRYDARSDRWADAGELPAPAVTVPAVRWDGGWVVPGGEVRPGGRSPEVWKKAP
ncbi:MAG: galactose oxidase, partial [Gemmataceae bacterium]